MRLEKADESGEKRRFTGAGPKLVCPDSGQLDEALSPARLTERCCKGVKRERKGIIWRRG